MLPTQSPNKVASSPPSERDLYLQIWDTFNQPEGCNLETDSLCYPTHFKQGNIEKYLTEHTKYKVLKLGEATLEEKLFLKQNNLDFNRLKLLHHQDHWEQQKKYIAEFNLENEIDIKSIEQLNLDQDIAFQQALIDTGYLYTSCPFSGQPIRSNQSFFWGHFIGIYRCVGEQVFYLIASQESFRKIFAYFPSLELIIKLSYSAVNPVKVINKWRGYVITNWKTVHSYLSFKDKRKKVNLIGFRNNVAHCCYNELAGIDLLRQTGRLDKIDKFIVGSNTYFGSLEELFPEIPQEKIIKITNESHRENGISPIFISSNFISVLEGSGGDNLHDDSYECDWRGIYEEAIQVIRRLKK